MWQTKDLQVRIADVWQLKGLRAKKVEVVEKKGLEVAVFSMRCELPGCVANKGVRREASRQSTVDSRQRRRRARKTSKLGNATAPKSYWGKRRARRVRGERLEVEDMAPRFSPREARGRRGKRGRGEGITKHYSMEVPIIK